VFAPTLRASQNSNAKQNNHAGPTPSFMEGCRPCHHQEHVMPQIEIQMLKLAEQTESMDIRILRVRKLIISLEKGQSEGSRRLFTQTRRFLNLLTEAEGVTTDQLADGYREVVSGRIGSAFC
jgi:hypothetical protein